MTRVGLLRLGYAALGLAILFLAGSFLPELGFLVLLSPLVAVAGAVLLAFSDDDLPKWAGLAFLAYAVLTLVAFLAATPATIRLSFWKGFANAEPTAVAGAVADYLVLALPIMIAATALVAAWEREHGPRMLLGGALAGIVAVAVLTVALNPSAGAAAADAPGAPGDKATQDVLRAQSQASSQAGLLSVLLALSIGTGSAGAIWAAVRPDEYH